MRYTVVAVPDESGTGYVAYVPAIPGCVTEGDDLSGALEMARDAAAAMLAVAAERGEELTTEAPGAVVA
jgi:predicted RNase H-like HicB family nuclease